MFGSEEPKQSLYVAVAGQSALSPHVNVVVSGATEQHPVGFSVCMQLTAGHGSTSHRCCWMVPLALHVAGGRKGTGTSMTTTSHILSIHSFPDLHCKVFPCGGGEQLLHPFRELCVPCVNFFTQQRVQPGPPVQVV